MRLAANTYSFAYFLLALCTLLLIGSHRNRIIVLPCMHLSAGQHHTGVNQEAITCMSSTLAVTSFTMAWLVRSTTWLYSSAHAVPWPPLPLRPYHHPSGRLVFSLPTATDRCGKLSSMIRWAERDSLLTGFVPSSWTIDGLYWSERTRQCE